MELIKAIALLCNFNTSSGSTNVSQWKCQKAYLSCVLDDSAVEGNPLNDKAAKVLARCVINGVGQ